jgi:threonylcarbamoyladenosine tRNA methylthiotransferase MtaB
VSAAIPKGKTGPEARTAPEARPDVDIVTFGCRLNAYESEVIRKRAAEDGLSDAIVFNTCAVTNEAVRQARQAIRKARRERPGAKLIVTGCAAQIDPAAFAAMTEVDLVLGNAEKSQAGAYAPQVEPMRVRVNDIMSVRETAGHLIDGLKDRARAYVEVQNGCDHRCTFCIIPYGRGNSRSAAAGEVVAQVQRLAAEGYREVVLTGVDVTSWGADLPGQPTLGQLVARILKLVPELPRLRLSSIDAAEIDPDLMRCLRDEPRLMPYLHLSLQAGDDMILKRMKRRHLRADALKLVAEVRAARPDTAFGADLIAGFPTETDEMFENTLKLVEEAGLAFLHVFPFSPRPGTPAARMPAVKRDVVKARAARLRAAGEAGLIRHLTRQIGRTLSGLIERPGVARAEDFTEIAFTGEAAVGGVTPLRVTGHDGRRLTAEVAACVSVAAVSAARSGSASMARPPRSASAIAACARRPPAGSSVRMSG